MKAILNARVHLCVCEGTQIGAEFVKELVLARVQAAAQHLSILKLMAMRLFVLAAFLGCSTAAREARDKPNIIMFFVDDLGYGDTGFNGHPTAESPNIDRLAFGGKKLTQWYSGCPVCSGSRAALMTGRQCCL